MAAAVFDADERPQWALSLTGIEQRFGAARRARARRAAAARGPRALPHTAPAILTLGWTERPILQR